MKPLSPNRGNSNNVWNVNNNGNVNNNNAYNSNAVLPILSLGCHNILHSKIRQ